MTRENLFKQRLTRQWHDFIKYLRYVFNDHAVIAFFFLFGAILFAYRQILETLPVNWVSQFVLLILLGLTLFFFKKPASLIKNADPVFFLGNENLLKQLWRASTRYSMAVNAVMQGLITLCFWPLLVKLFTPNLLILVLFTVILMGIKACITLLIAKHTASFNHNSPLMNWRAIAQAEEQRLTSIYNFFNLFVDVPGLTSQVKVHPWLEKVGHFWSTHTKQPLVPLYITTFLRKSPYFSVWIRTLLIGGILIPFIHGWLLLGLLLLLQYLCFIQIIPLVGSYRRLAFDSVIPVNLAMRKKAFHSFCLPLLMLLDVVWCLIGWGCQNQTVFILIIPVIFSLILVFWYSNYSINNMFKRRTKNASKK